MHFEVERRATSRASDDPQNLRILDSSLERVTQYEACRSGGARKRVRNFTHACQIPGRRRKPVWEATSIELRRAATACDSGCAWRRRPV